MRRLIMQQSKIDDDMLNKYYALHNGTLSFSKGYYVFSFIICMETHDRHLNTHTHTHTHTHMHMHMHTHTHARTYLYNE